MARQVGLEQAPRIRPADAKAAFDRDEAVFVDVRPEEYYERSHVPGAVQMRLQQLGQRFSELPRDRKVIFY